jgi:formate-dependent nitrite reductase cytochrome c552 subunit
MAKRHLSTLIEEMQTVVNRMEAGLEDKDSYGSVREFLKKANADLNKAKKELKAINADIEHYNEVRAKILKEVLEAERFHAPSVEILVKEGLQ